MTRTDSDFWLSRLTQSVESALAAPSPRARAAYLELARHYRSMHRLTARPANRSQGRESMATSLESSVQQFNSIHDTLRAA